MTLAIAHTEANAANLGVIVSMTSSEPWKCASSSPSAFASGCRLLRSAVD